MKWIVDWDYNRFTTTNRFSFLKLMGWQGEKSIEFSQGNLRNLYITMSWIEIVWIGDREVCMLWKIYLLIGTVVAPLEIALVLKYRHYLLKFGENSV